MKKALALLGVIAAGSSAMAVPITGSIGFTGTYTANGATGNPVNLTTASSMTINTVGIDSANGDLTGAGAPLSFASPIGVNANSTDLLGDQLWSVTVGTKTYTFQVSTEVQSTTLPNSIGLTGLGTLSDGPGGLDDTLGEWQINFGRSGSGATASFTWQSTTGSLEIPVPDGGATAMLLGVGLLGLGAVRRKVA